MSRTLDPYNSDAEEIDNQPVNEHIKKRGLPENHPLQLLNFTRNFNTELSYEQKTKIEHGGRVYLTPEKNVYRIFAGYHPTSCNPLEIIINPKFANDHNYCLSLPSLLTLILPITVLSELLNASLYNHSLFKGENYSLWNDTSDNVKNLKSAAKDVKRDAFLKLLFTALLGIYQVIRIPILIAGVITGLAIWLPQMILGFIMSSLTFGTRPIWQPIANAIHNRQQTDEPPEENITIEEGEEVQIEEVEKSGRTKITFKVPNRDEVSNFFGGLIYAFSKLFSCPTKQGYFKPDDILELSSSLEEDDSSEHQL